MCSWAHPGVFFGCIERGSKKRQYKNPKGKVAGEWNGREDPQADEQEISRMYTPTTSDKDLGRVELVIKVYKGGANERFVDVRCRRRPSCQSPRCSLATD